MTTLAHLYAILDISIQQLAIGLAILSCLIALAWYVSHPAHRRRLLGPTRGPGSRTPSSGDVPSTEALPRVPDLPLPIAQVCSTRGEVVGGRVRPEVSAAIVGGSADQFGAHRLSWPSLSAVAKKLDIALADSGQPRQFHTRHRLEHRNDVEGPPVFRGSKYFCCTSSISCRRP